MVLSCSGVGEDNLYVLAPISWRRRCELFAMLQNNNNNNNATIILPLFWALATPDLATFTKVAVFQDLGVGDTSTSISFASKILILL